MTRKHYIRIARMFLDRFHASPPEHRPVIARLVEDIARVFREDNPTRFDRDRFLEACGYNLYFRPVTKEKPHG